MKLVDLPFFVGLGSSLEEASKIDPEGTLFAAYFALNRLANDLDKLASGEHARLPATEHDLKELRGLIEEFIRNHFSFEGKWRFPNEDERAEFEISQLVQVIKQFRTVLIADLRTCATFTVVRSGIFDVNMLVNCAHNAIALDARQKLGRDILEEIDASGKCLAFNLPTASGFHAMRAVERVIQKYLSVFFSQDEISKWKNWGNYIQALERRLTGEDGPKPSVEAVALIRQIKDIYRNPVIHAERVLSLDEASTLFHSTLAAINRISIEINNNKRAKGVLGGLLDVGAVALLAEG